MVSDRVYFGKGKIKGIVAISRKYWDNGNISSVDDKLIFSGDKGSTEILKADIKSVEMVKHRAFKVIRITKNNGDFYHICSIPRGFALTAYTASEDFSGAAQDVKRQNKVLFDTINIFLNS
jgi:hypothetical protein